MIPLLKKDEQGKVIWCRWFIGSPFKSQGFSREYPSRHQWSKEGETSRREATQGDLSIEVSHFAHCIVFKKFPSQVLGFDDLSIDDPSAG
jgi:hypothetical protein